MVPNKTDITKTFLMGSPRMKICSVYQWCPLKFIMLEIIVSQWYDRTQHLLRLVIVAQPNLCLLKKVPIVKKVEDQINYLVPTKVVLGEKEFIVRAKMVLCIMIDGKVYNALASCTSTQRCYLRGTKSSDMNNLQALSQKEVDPNCIAFALSPLHARIRFFERVLRHEHMAEITGVNKEVIYRFSVILECLNSGFPIDEVKLGEYFHERLELYFQYYHWYTMSVSIHKVLCHGQDIIAASILPIGQLSEKAQEARNNDSGKCRELFMRKDSRVHSIPILTS
nr:unnamed protein product [Callosobruchus analis]